MPVHVALPVDHAGSALTTSSGSCRAGRCPASSRTVANTIWGVVIAVSPAHPCANQFVMNLRAPMPRVAVAAKAVPPTTIAESAGVPAARKINPPALPTNTPVGWSAPLRRRPTTECRRFEPAGRPAHAVASWPPWASCISWGGIPGRLTRRAQAGLTHDGRSNRVHR